MEDLHNYRPETIHQWEDIRKAQGDSTGAEDIMLLLVVDQPWEDHPRSNIVLDGYK
jgi:hypothetical protein